MRVRVIKESLPYSTKYHKVGTTLDMEDGHARMLIAIGRVEKFTPPPVVEVKQAKVTRKKRTYRRRDMQAEQTVALKPSENDE